MKQVTLTIQNGHRNALHGATGTNGEVDLIDKVYFALAPILIKAGIQVFYEDDGLWDADGNFTGLLNGNKDYFIALHFDGATNPSYDGGFVDDTPDDLVKEQSWKLAGMVADYYFGPMGIRFAPEHRTVNSTDYYAFYATGTNTKQFLIELGTLTNPSDKAKCQDYGKIATLLAKGIVSYLTQFDTTYQAYLQGQPSPTPTPIPVPDTTEIDSLRKQLQASKDAFTKLQQTTDEQLANRDRDCQALLQDKKVKIKSFVDNV